MCKSIENGINERKEEIIGEAINRWNRMLQDEHMDKTNKTQTEKGGKNAKKGKVDNDLINKAKQLIIDDTTSDVTIYQNAVHNEVEKSDREVGQVETHSLNLNSSDELTISPDANDRLQINVDQFISEV